MPLSLMVPLFFTLHVFWKVPPLIVLQFVTLPAKVPPVISTPDEITIAHATGVVVDVPGVLPWGWVELKSYVPL